MDTNTSATHKKNISVPKKKTGGKELIEFFHNVFIEAKSFQSFVETWKQFNGSSSGNF